MLEKGKTWHTVRLPAGTWKDQNRNVRAGPADYTLGYPLEQLYIKKNVRNVYGGSI